MNENKSTSNKENLIKSDFIKDRMVRVCLVFSLIVNFISWLIVFFKIGSLIDPVILKYNAYFGVIMEGQKTNLYALPLLAFFVILLNGSLAYSISQRYMEAAKILLATSLIFNVMIAISIYSLILVNKV